MDDITIFEEKGEGSCIWGFLEEGGEGFAEGRGALKGVNENMINKNGNQNNSWDSQQTIFSFSCEM